MKYCRAESGNTDLSRVFGPVSVDIIVIRTYICYIFHADFEPVRSSQGYPELNTSQKRGYDYVLRNIIPYRHANIKYLYLNILLPYFLNVRIPPACF